AREVVFPYRPANAVEHLERLAVGVQRLPLTAREASRSQYGFDPVLLVLFGDGREAQNFPLLMAEDVADEVVFMEPLHDDDYGAMLLVVLPAVEGVVIPFVGELPLCVGDRLLGLERIIDKDDVGAAPGQHTASCGGEP